MRRVLAPLLVWFQVLAPLLAGLVSLPTGFAAEVQTGRLLILRNGKAIGSEHYQISGTATEFHARGDIRIESQGQKMRQTTSLVLNADLSPRRYEWKLEEPREKRLWVEFEKGQAIIAFPREDGKQEQQLYEFGTARVALLDINVFHHFLLLARLYDFSRGGPQTIPVFIPQSVQPGSVTVELEEVETLTVEGEPQPVRRLSITSEDNHLLLWITEGGHFVRLRVPQANVEVVPEGAP